MKEVAVVGVDGEEGDKSEDPEGRSDSERGSGSGCVFSTTSAALALAPEVAMVDGTRETREDPRAFLSSSNP